MRRLFVILKKLDFSLETEEPAEIVDLNIGYAHEALDRAFIMNDMFDGYLVNHPFISQNDHILEKAEEISSLMFDLYQLISNEYFERYEDNSGDGELRN